MVVAEATRRRESAGGGVEDVEHAAVEPDDDVVQQVGVLWTAVTSTRGVQDSSPEGRREGRDDGDRRVEHWTDRATMAFARDRTAPRRVEAVVDAPTAPSRAAAGRPRQARVLDVPELGFEVGHGLPREPITGAVLLSGGRVVHLYDAAADSILPAATASFSLARCFGRSRSFLAKNTRRGRASTLLRGNVFAGTGLLRRALRDSAFSHGRTTVVRQSIIQMPRFVIRRRRARMNGSRRRHPRHLLRNPLDRRPHRLFFQYRPTRVATPDKPAVVLVSRCVARRARASRTEAVTERDRQSKTKTDRLRGP